ncbi:hypothetical protein [Nocardioides sp. R-C-SC26]|uniref:hypothetical protein n=1 Tax=Nocardioides sp. R-C-SC26 TaxID=2870414 RepID=UPI001E28883F|nr:hypothetical protein [Nocardioides sp. R-C-SC26]
MADRTRLHAALGLGVLVLIAVSTTWAHWTDAAAVSGTTLTAGTLDLKADNADAVTTATLSMSAMVPGSSSAQVITLKNGGTAALTWTASGGLGGTDAAAFAASGAVRIRLVAGGTRSGSGSAATCTGGAVVLTSTPLTASTTTTLVGVRQGPIAASATQALCVELTLDGAAPSTLQGRTTTVSLTVAATSDVT